MPFQLHTESIFQTASNEMLEQEPGNEASSLILMQHMNRSSQLLLLGSDLFNTASHLCTGV